MQDIDDDILKKASEGDLKSFETIYKTTAGFVYNVALRIVNNKEDAEEVTQEVFMVVYNKLKYFRFESSFKTWVYRITANHAINFSKKISKIRNKTMEYDEQLTSVASHEPKTEIDQEQHNQTINKLLNAINHEQRACVVLRNMEGLSYQQIAETLKINVNTVRSRLKRAREKLLELRKRMPYEQLR